MNDRANRVFPELKGGDKRDQPPDDTFLISRCVALRRKPLDEFTTEDLRITIAKNFSPSTFDSTGAGRGSRETCLWLVTSTLAICKVSSWRCR